MEHQQYIEISVGVLLYNNWMFWEDVSGNCIKNNKNCSVTFLLCTCV